jgi:hypothetical protein
VGALKQEKGGQSGRIVTAGGKKKDKKWRRYVRTRGNHTCPEVVAESGHCVDRKRGYLSVEVVAVGWDKCRKGVERGATIEEAG